MTEIGAPQRIVQEDPLDAGGGWYKVAAVLLVLAAVGGAWASRQTIEQRSDTGSLPLSIFAALLGLAALVFALWHTWRFRKFGSSTLETTAPIAGKRWQGAVRTTHDLAATGDFTLTLSYEELRSKLADHKLAAVTLWKGVCTVERSTVRSSQGIPFAFLPPGAELARSSSGGTWWLRVDAPMRGLNYMTLFDVTRLLEAPPSGRPWLGEALEALTNR